MYATVVRVGVGVGTTSPFRRVGTVVENISLLGSCNAYVLYCKMARFLIFSKKTLMFLRTK